MVMSINWMVSNIFANSVRVAPFEYLLYTIYLKTHKFLKKKHKLTSILKVLLKQYLCPTGPNKYLRGITPTKTDKVKLDMF